MYENYANFYHHHHPRTHGLTLVAAPAGEPITLDEAYKHLRLPEEEDSALISGLITAARQYFEEIDDRRLLSQTWKLTLDRFAHWNIEIPLRPLQLINSIKYIDSAGVQQTMDSADYHVDLTSFHARVSPAYGKYWPVTRWQDSAVEVEFVCGYGDATTVNDPAFDGTNYDLEILPNYVVKFGVTLKTETGFHINFDTAAPADASIDIVASGGTPRQTLLRQTVAIDEDALSADVVFSQTLPSPSTIVGGVPLHLKQALLLLLGDFYENRENSTFAPNITQLPFAFKALVGANRHIQI